MLRVGERVTLGYFEGVVDHRTYTKRHKKHKEDVDFKWLPKVAVYVSSAQTAVDSIEEGVECHAPEDDE